MEVESSPCKECIVNVMCGEFCPPANKYAHRNRFIDIYMGRVVAKHLKWEKVNPSTGKRNFFLGGVEKMIEDGEL